MFGRRYFFRIAAAIPLVSRLPKAIAGISPESELRKILNEAKREFNPDAGDLGRARIWTTATGLVYTPDPIWYHGAVASNFQGRMPDPVPVTLDGIGLHEISAELVDMGFRPLVVNPESADEFGQRYPVYSASGALCASIYRVWIRERDGKHECVAVESYLRSLI